MGTNNSAFCVCLQLKGRIFWNYRDSEIRTYDLTFYYNYGTKQFSTATFYGHYLKLLGDYENGNLTQHWYNRASGKLCAKIIYRRQDHDEGLTFARLKKLISGSV